MNADKNGSARMLVFACGFRQISKIGKTSYICVYQFLSVFICVKILSSSSVFKVQSKGGGQAGGELPGSRLRVDLRASVPSWLNLIFCPRARG
jgi:hypothetical protein